MRKFLMPLVALLLTADAAAAAADVKATIEQIERRPRATRLAAYEKALADAALAPADRVELVRAFARHAKDVSPAYGKNLPIETPAWVKHLKAGFEADPRDLNIALALAQLHIDRNNPAAALPVVKAMKAAHPEHHHALAWLAWCVAATANATANANADATPGKPTTRAESAKSGDVVLTFPVHFIVLTKNPQAHKVATAAQCRKECEILNDTFRALDGKVLARFEFKGFTPYEQLKDAPDQLLRYGDSAEPYDTDDVAKAFNGCKDKRLRDPGAINFYVYDAHSPKAGAADVTSHGKRNSNRPFVLLDWERLDGKIQNAEAHEMGHAFGLEHVGVPGAKAQTSTNIMASVSEQFGSGGKRDLGFSPAQAALIRYHAARTAERLKLRR